MVNSFHTLGGSADTFYKNRFFAVQISWCIHCCPFWIQFSFHMVDVFVLGLRFLVYSPCLWDSLGFKNMCQNTIFVDFELVPQVEDKQVCFNCALERSSDIPFLPMGLFLILHLNLYIDEFHNFFNRSLQYLSLTEYLMRIAGDYYSHFCLFLCFVFCSLN